MNIYFIKFESNYHYVRLIIKGLKQKGVTIRKTTYPSPMSSFSIAVNGGVFHINWPEFYYKMGKGLIKMLVSIMLALSLIISMMIMRFLFGIRVVFSLHNLLPHNSERRWLDRIVYSAVIFCSSSVICHCIKAKELINEHYPTYSGKVIVIPHPNFMGVYGDKMNKYEMRDILNLPQDVYIYIFFGKVRAYKGIKELVKEFREVGGTEDRLLIVGSDDGTGYIEEIKRIAGDDERIMIRGIWVLDEFVNLYMSCADCLVLPYRDILTSGGVLLSAQYCIPLVAPAIGCIPEQVDGRMAVLYDEGGLGDALRRIKGLKEREVIEGSRAVMERTALDVVTNRLIEDVYGGGEELSC